MSEIPFFSIDFHNSLTCKCPIYLRKRQNTIKTMKMGNGKEKDFFYKLEEKSCFQK
ncbi:hypothetical protein LEP1GSC036_3593 [Leptospira weilii str. 2006001853]|uniref:Uncharacterized protein n=2 Tax=Leptospira weilii TaxID=28184 RepID=A0A828Z9B9_9LEPT|nr:hypothetical protein LEP1GSC036_3593 [Leptospira weilii str. 2006001853]EMM73119.1 hypothetical protein LEP1GSC038_1528 [Leptospira weilii str. 2006001855]EMN45431.1 hypothetical protein LEP1GSC086_3896 [Leptospira weilii str. LNT 1234]